MGYGGFIVIASFVIIFLWLLGTIFARDGLTYCGEGAIVSWIMLLLGALFLDDVYLKLAFWFSLPVTAAMVFLADPYLAARTLRYGCTFGSLFSRRVRATPIWMVLLWWVAATQMVYFCLRADEVMVYFGIEMNEFGFVMLVLFFGYFLSFELLVCNFTNWWERRNCKEIFGVAIYAMIAEAMTVAIVYGFSILLKSNVGAPVWFSIPIGLGAAILIAPTFISSCFMFYRKT